MSIFNITYRATLVILEHFIIIVELPSEAQQCEFVGSGGLVGQIFEKDSAKN
jgi:hypothetical protein